MTESSDLYDCRWADNALSRNNEFKIKEFTKTILVKI